MTILYCTVPAMALALQDPTRREIRPTPPLVVPRGGGGSLGQQQRQGGGGTLCVEEYTRPSGGEGQKCANAQRPIQNRKTVVPTDFSYFFSSLRHIFGQAQRLGSGSASGMVMVLLLVMGVPVPHRSHHAQGMSGLQVRGGGGVNRAPKILGVGGWEKG